VEERKYVQNDQEVSVHLMITTQSSQRLFYHPVYIGERSLEKKIFNPWVKDSKYCDGDEQWGLG